MKTLRELLLEELVAADALQVFLFKMNETLFKSLNHYLQSDALKYEHCLKKEEKSCLHPWHR